MNQINERHEGTHFDQDIANLRLMNIADSEIITMANNMIPTVPDKETKGKFKKLVTDCRVRLRKRINEIKELETHTLISDFYGVYCSRCGKTVRKN
jgi:hypothetical protein